MRYFAIRHIPSGHYLPNTGKTKGFTHHEPVPAEMMPPRLFMTSSAAKTSRRIWLQGAWTRSAGYDSWSGENWEDDNVRPRPNRIPEEMEVVEISLHALRLDPIPPGLSDPVTF